MQLNPKSWTLPAWQIPWQANDIRAMRLALGVTIAMALALGINWPLSFITPILTLSFLTVKGPCFGLKGGLKLLGVMILAGMVGLAVTIFFIDYPIVCMLIIGVLLMNIFYLNAAGSPALLVTLLLLSITIIPILGQQSNVLALGFAQGILVAVIVAMLMTWFMHALLPDSADAFSDEITPESVMKKLDEHQRLNSALTSTFVVLPIILLFFTFELTNSALIMIFVVMLAQNPDLQAGFKGCMAMIVGNSIGGFVAIVFYSLLTLAPTYTFMVLLMLLVSLLASSYVYSEKKYAPLIQMALSTVVLLIGSTVMSDDANAGTKFYERIIQIFGVTLYVVGAFSLAQLANDRLHAKSKEQAC